MLRFHRGGQKILSAGIGFRYGLLVRFISILETMAAQAV
jgi:hypothetical protein